MRARRIVLNLIAAATAAVLLSGCYVTATKLPASTAPVQDAQLIGNWRAIDEDGKPDDTFLHIIKVSDGKPLVLAMVDTHNVFTYALTSLKVGDRQMFAVKQSATVVDKIEPNYIIGFYQVKGDMLEFRMLDPEKIQAAITAKQLQGRVEKADPKRTILTSSPKELAAFFAGTDVAKLTDGKWSRAQRIK